MKAGQLRSKVYIYYESGTELIFGIIYTSNIRVHISTSSEKAPENFSENDHGQDRQSEAALCCHERFSSSCSATRAERHYLWLCLRTNRDQGARWMPQEREDPPVSRYASTTGRSMLATSARDSPRSVQGTRRLVSQTGTAERDSSVRKGTTQRLLVFRLGTGQ